MTDDEYLTRISEHLNQFSDSAITMISASTTNQECSCWVFVVFPERFHSHLGIELRKITIYSDKPTSVDTVLDQLCKSEDYSMDRDLDPEDFSTPPEDRFELLTKASIEWIESSLLNRCDFKSPVYAGGPDDSQVFSFQEDSWVRLPFWH